MKLLNSYVLDTYIHDVRIHSSQLSWVPGGLTDDEAAGTDAITLFGQWTYVCQVGIT